MRVSGERASCSLCSSRCVLREPLTTQSMGSHNESSTKDTTVICYFNGITGLLNAGWLPKLYRLNRLYSFHDNRGNKKYEKTNEKGSYIYHCHLPPHNVYRSL